MSKRRSIETHVTRSMAGLVDLDETNNAPLGSYFSKDSIIQMYEDVGLPGTDESVDASLKAGGHGEARYTSGLMKLWRDLETTAEGIRFIEAQDRHPALKMQRESLLSIEKEAKRLLTSLNPDSLGRISFMLRRALEAGSKKTPELDFDETLERGIKFLQTVLEWRLTEIEDIDLAVPSKRQAPDLALGLLEEIYERFYGIPAGVSKASESGGPWVRFMRLCLPVILSDSGVSTERDALIARYLRYKKKDNATQGGMSWPED